MPGGGPHPKDTELFHADQLDAMRTASRELGYLRRQGYALDSALKLVGDKYQLRERQRVAIRRATSQAGGAVVRARRRAPAGAPPPAAVWLDGFNVVITCETALNSGVLVTTVDDGLRDLAGIHGTYRTSDVTDAAIALLARALADRGWNEVPCRWLLDAPVSNTGRLAARLREHAEAAGLPWTVEIVPDPDEVLSSPGDGVTVATGDSVVLDRCARWLDLAGEAIRAHVPDAWIVDLDVAARVFLNMPATIETDRFRLRPPARADADWIFRDYAQDAEVTRYLMWSPHQAIGETHTFLEGCVEAWRHGRRLTWAIERRTDGRGLGMLECNMGPGGVEVGYVLAREHWGQGTMPEVVTALTERLLALPDLFRVWAITDEENLKSGRVLEKAGFEFEGVLRRYGTHPGVSREPRDVRMYSRVKE